MKTWDDVKNLYYSIAYRYCKRYRQFRVDELVNEAWIMTYPYINTEGYKLPHKIHRVIQRYIKSQYESYLEGDEKRNVAVCSIEANNEEINIHELLPDLRRQVDEVEIADSILLCIRSLNFDERVLLYLRFYFELSLEHIGKLLGMSKQAVNVKLEDVYNRMRNETDRKQRLDNIRNIVNCIRC